jgi:polyhydroxybutyrate depolymerase
MKGRTMVIGAVLTLISLPGVVTLIAAITFHVQNRNNGSLVSSGRKREYLLYVPKSYNRARPAPLVITMHGAGGWPVQQRDLSEWNRVAEREGFIVAYPSGLKDGVARVWGVRPGPGPIRDVQFIAELIDKLAADYNIDRARIYANGISNGGGMAFLLSCTLSDRIAAFGMVAAAQTLPWSACTDRRPAPMIAFHGTADPLTPYHGGTTWVFPRAFPDISKWTANWARRNQCDRQPVENSVAAGVSRREYTGCADDAAVVLYTIRGGGHSWPGGKPMPEWFVGPTSGSIDATSEMWAFFRDHPRVPRTHRSEVP